jgi:hypothetical protein
MWRAHHAFVIDLPVGRFSSILVSANQEHKMANRVAALRLSYIYLKLAALSFLCLLAAYTLISPASAQKVDTPAQQAIDNQLRAFLADKDEEAYSYAAPNVRTYFPTVESFMGMVKSGYTAVHRPQSWEYGRVRDEGGAVFQEVLITDQAGKNWAALYTLAQQPDGSWKITGVSLRKADTLTM